MLQDCLKKSGIDPRSYGLKRNQFPTFHSNIQADITPKPQQVTTTQLTSTEAPFQQTSPTPTPQGTIPQVAPTIEPKFIVFSEKGTAGTLNGLYLGLKAFFPYAKDLSEEEQRALGEMWTPIFNKYLSEKMEIVLAIIATVGIFGSKITIAHKLKKEKQQEQNKKEKEEN